MQRFVAHYRSAEAYCAYEVIHRSMEAPSAASAVFPATLFAAACFLFSRLLQVISPTCSSRCMVAGRPF